MNNYPIKSVTFGGFDKQDVISYIERITTEVSAVQKELQEEAEHLRRQLEESEAARESLAAELEEANRGREETEAHLKEERALRESLQPVAAEAEELRREVEAMRAEQETLRADAQDYVRFREKLGAIECEAHMRAADLESSTYTQLRETVDLFRSQYQVLMSTFETAAAHVNGELRKVEVNLTQLPRALDRSGAELEELAARLEQRKES